MSVLGSVSGIHHLLLELFSLVGKQEQPAPARYTLSVRTSNGHLLSTRSKCLTVICERGLRPHCTILISSSTEPRSAQPGWAYVADLTPIYDFQSRMAKVTFFNSNHSWQLA